MKFFASCAKGLEYLLVDELLALGCRHATATMAGANVEGTLEDAQRAVLWSRLASRILWPIAEFECADEHALYAGAMAVDWPAHLDPSTTIAVDAHVSGDAITHARYAALRVKDAVCDVLRDRVGDRPDVDTEAPDVRIDLLVRKGIAIISIDLGGPLHKRGWRQAQGEAPLKENLAAAVLMRGNWPAVYADGGGLLDPMCGSGTLLIEGALMAADVAPGLLRHGDAWPTRWFGFERAVWTGLVEEARAREIAGRAALRADLVGSDSDPHAIYAAEQNAWAAGVSNAISWQVLDVESLETAQVDPRGVLTTGLVACNPPYDARLQADPALYRALGDGLRRAVPTWRASILCGNPALAQATGLRAGKRYQLFNGALECLLIVCARIGTEAIAMRPADAAARAVVAAGANNADGDASSATGAAARHAGNAAPATPAIPLDPGAQMVANRLRKNIRKFASWRKRDGIACYRVYDADLPEYAAAIDVYTEAGNGQAWLHVQEYAAPSEIPEDTARGRLEALLAAAREVFDVPVQRVSLKTRLRGKGGSRYAQAGSANAPDMHGQFLVVREGDALLRINLFDHLDSGLFLDHRPMRLQLGAQAEDARFLNLFAYTGAATVHAALGGARTTTTVDLSPTYLQWAADNLQANGFSGGKHRLVQADALAWLEAETAQYDLIFCDPPTFSNSARAADFDLQREHVRLLQAAVARLAPGGVLYFSNNARRFKLDIEVVATFALCEDISARTIDPDFARNPRIHQAWRLHALSA